MNAKTEDSFLPITMENETLEFQGFRKLVTYDYREHESGLRAKRELVIGDHAVAVVIYDPALEKLVMVRQFRLGAQLGTGRGLSVEIAAGLIDEGEDPLECAKREMLEETGLSPTRIEPLCKFSTTPGLTNETIQLFYAEADASEMKERAGLDAESEQTFPFLLSFEEAMDAVDMNAIQNGIAMLGLMWFARHYEKLAKLTT